MVKDINSVRTPEPCISYKVYVTLSNHLNWLIRTKHKPPQCKQQHRELYNQRNSSHLDKIVINQTRGLWSVPIGGVPVAGRGTSRAPPCWGWARPRRWCTWGRPDRSEGRTPRWERLEGHKGHEHMTQSLLDCGEWFLGNTTRGREEECQQLVLGVNRPLYC